MLEFGPHQFRRESRMSPTKKAWCQKLSKKGDLLPSLKLTAKAPNNRPGPKRKAIFQSSGFQELMCWSQGVCNWSPNSAAKTKPKGHGWPPQTTFIQIQSRRIEVDRRSRTTCKIFVATGKYQFFVTIRLN